VSGLRDDLVHDRVDQTDFAIYAFLVSGVALPIWMVSSTELELKMFQLVSFASALAQLVVAIVGTRACYIANGGSAGRRFLDRFISLGWVMGVRVALLLAIPMMLIQFVVSEVASVAVADVAQESVFVAGSALYYWGLATQMSLVQRSAGPANR